MVRDRPTVTTNGVVRSMASAQDMSLTKDAIAFICIGVSNLLWERKMAIMSVLTYYNDGPNLTRRRQLKLYWTQVSIIVCNPFLAMEDEGGTYRFKTRPVEDKEKRPQQGQIKHSDQPKE